MRAARLQDALERLTSAIRDVESELAAMKADHDPLASHIFVSRRHYRNVNDTKSGKRREMMAHGSSSEAVNDSTTFSGFAKSTGSRLAIKNAYSHRILSDSIIIRWSDCCCSSTKPSFRTTLHRNAKALYWLCLGLMSGGLGTPSALPSR